MTQSNTPPESVVELVRDLVGDPALSTEQISRVIVNYHYALEGEPVGTSFIHDDGTIARRVAKDGVPKWCVLGDEETSWDTRKTFDGVEGWTLMKRPTPA